MFLMMLHRLVFILILFIVQTTSEQHLLGTHFYVNQDNILIDNTLKTVSTLARPYDLVAFIGQSERLARVDHLQTYIDAVDDVVEVSSQQQSSQATTDKHNTNENIDKCNDFLGDGESSIFKILKTNLYDTFHIPFELKNISKTYSTNEIHPTSILTCNHFCHLNSSLLTFDHLPSISTRYDEQQVIRIDEEEINNLTITKYDKQALWSVNELTINRTAWLAYVYLSRYFHANLTYHHAIDCLRCALIYGSNYNDVVLIELANIVFRYGYIRDAIIFIEQALDHHLRLKPTNVESLFIRSILHFYLGNLCTIDNRFILAIQFYNKTKILLERIINISDEQQLEALASPALDSLSITSLLSISQQKINALNCHLTLELSLQRKHHILQTKLAQLNQLRSITDELIQLNSLIKRDMSHGQSYIEYLRQLKTGKHQVICHRKTNRKARSIHDFTRSNMFSYRRKYADIMKQEVCSIDDYHLFLLKTTDDSNTDEYECQSRENYLVLDGEIDHKTEHLSLNEQQNLISLRLAAIEQTQSAYVLEENRHEAGSIEITDQTTLTSTTTWPTLTSRLPTEVIVEPKKKFILKQLNVLYPSPKQKLVIKLTEQQLPSYTDCQRHYYGLPSIGDYPTVWLPLENKGLLNIKQAFYQGLHHQFKHYPLPWSPPICTLNKPIDEQLSIIENHVVLSRTSRSKAPTNRYDTNMLLNLYLYIDSTIDEQLPIEEFGQRLRAVGEKREQLLPEWIVHLLSSLYWRVNGHLPHAIECGLQAHESLIKNKSYKQWSDLTLVNLANILYLWGKYEDALDLTEQAYAINSHEPITNYLLGNLLALTKNNHTAAQEQYRRTLAIDPTHIYARRQLRLSYCHMMFKAWETAECSKERVISSNYKFPLTDESYSSPGDERSAADRWLNRTSRVHATKREELVNDARRAYRLYGLCSSSVTSSTITSYQINDECLQGFAVTDHGDDIGHIIIMYDHIKHTFDYSFLFTNDYKSMFLVDSKLKCIIYGTGRKSSKCREVTLIDPNEVNPKHNMTWWRDPSTLYEHLKEFIEIMNYENEFNNKTQLDFNKSYYERYFSDHYVLSKEIQDKYLLKNDVHFNDKDCLNKSTVTFTPYLSTWISPQTKNVYLNYSFFKQLNKDRFELGQPICRYPIIQHLNTTKDVEIIDYIIKKVNQNLTLYRPETILKPVLISLLFDKSPTVANKEVDDKALIGSYLASGLNSPAYNTSWLFYHTVSLYWRLMGNASQALNCLFQSYTLSPSNVHDYTYLSMALMIYNGQLHINEAIYLLYESLSIDPKSLLLTHFTLGNAMARKGRLDFAEEWYQSTLKLKFDFEPAKQRLRAIQC